jgi:predicted transcriptional regulator
MPSPQDKKQISIRVPTDVIAEFDKIAAKIDRDRTWVMLRALRLYLEGEDEWVAAQEAAAPEAVVSAQGDSIENLNELAAQILTQHKA